MGKSRNTKYNNYYYDDDEFVDNRKDKKNKSQERRFERALRVKDVNELVEEDIDDFEDNYSTFEEEKL